jgi:NCS1 family nucleobase:cation symporter-1
MAKSNALEVEQNGLNVIPESERRGSPRDQFWPWAASNISVFGISYAGFILGFGLNFGQALLAAVVGIVFSFSLVGIIALAGKRGSAPTLVLSRAVFGVNGNAVPTFFSYLLLVGWETVLVALGVLATDTVSAKLGWTLGANNIGVKGIAFVVIVAIVISSGVYGFNFIMRIQKWITLASIVLTGAFIALTAGSINFAAVGTGAGGDAAAVVAGIVFAMTGCGIGWVNGGADYSRYLPRNASGKAIFGWTTFGASIAPIVLIVYGLLLSLSNTSIGENIGSDPIGSLTLALPASASWFLVPYLLVVLLGFMGGAILDIYSSGLNLLTLGLKLKRPQAAAVDGVLMVIGVSYFVFIADNFFWPFQAFLYLLGVPMAAWAGIFIADMIQRKKNYDDAGLYSANGRYGSVNWGSISILAVATFVGFGFVASPDTSITWTTWEGYLYAALGINGDNSSWYWSNMGVLLAIVVGFVGKLALGGAAVKKQER